MLQAALQHLEPHQKKELASQLENPWVLDTLVRDKHGTFTAQACVPHLQPSGVEVEARHLAGKVLDLGRDGLASHFLQAFIGRWAGEESVWLLCGEVVSNTAELLLHSTGTHLLQVQEAVLPP